MNLLTRLRLGEGLSAGERALAEALLADLDALDRATVKLALSPQKDHARKVSPFGTGLSLLFVLDALFARCFVEDYDANLARRFAYYDRIVGMGGCGGAST